MMALLSALEMRWRWCLPIRARSRPLAGRGAGCDGAGLPVRTRAPRRSPLPFPRIKPGAVHAIAKVHACGRTSVFVRGMAPRLVSDAIAALTAVNSRIGPSPHGSVVGLLDFGGSMTSPWWRPRIPGTSDVVSATARYQDSSGSQIDQALLLRVIDTTWVRR